MIYDVTVSLVHRYLGTASSGRHILRLLPRAIAGHQDVLSHRLTSDPAASEWYLGSDFFGNPTHMLNHDDAHAEMGIQLKTRVQRFAQSEGFDTSPPLGKLAAEIAADLGLAPDAPHHFIGPSLRIPPVAAIAEYAAPFRNPAASTRDIVLALGAALHADMTFDSTVTTVDTPIEEAFRNRHGVCQDFAQIMIGGLRSLGIPARYVSGFLRTLPPKGQPRLEGADAMHAWVSAWCGADLCWVEYDPTNGIFAGLDHITVGYGRDYSDVAPIKGVLRGSGHAFVGQGVDVVAVDG